jgi:4-hydroxy 2-oxovalerate aldolase
MQVYPKFMDHKIKILDCTLRDGGYYNDWNFSSNLSQRYLQSITKLPIDIIEVGYVSKNKNDNFGLHYHLNVSYLKNIKKKLKKIKSYENSYEIFDIDDKKDFNYFTKNLIRRI